METTGFEPATFGVANATLSQLSYVPKTEAIITQ